MHRQLPKELNIHTLSFLSSKEALHTSFVNKSSMKLTKDPYFWKIRLKEEFCLTDFKKNQNFFETHKELSKQLSIENELYSDLITAYLFSLQIQLDTIAGKNQDPWETLLNISHSAEHKIQSARHGHFRRMEELDQALLQSKEQFNVKRDLLYKQFPTIDLVEIKNHTKNYLFEKEPSITLFLTSLPPLDKNSFITSTFLLAAKSNSAISMRIFLSNNKDNLPNHFLEDLLHTSAAFLSIDIAKVLIEFGADVNCLVDDYDFYGNYSQTTPLFEVLNALRRQRKSEPTKSIETAKEFVQLLLGHGADPLARIYLGEDGQEPPAPESQAFESAKKSIHELCLLAKEHPRSNSIELLDLVIEAGDKKETNNKLKFS